MSKLCTLVMIVIFFVAINSNPARAFQKNPQNTITTAALEQCAVKLEDRSYETKAVGRHAIYYFLKDSIFSQQEMFMLTNRYDAILDFAKNNLGLTFSEPIIYILDEPEDFRIETQKIVICPFDDNNIGAVMSYTGYGALPAWLCSGIELLCLDNTDLLYGKYGYEINVNSWTSKQNASGFPEFSDFWFFPESIDTANISKRDARNISARFVKFIAENDKLIKVVSDYTKRKTLADKEIKLIWDTFAGNDVPINLNIMYTFERYQTLIVYTDQQNYYFYERGWTWNNIQKYIQMIEDSRKFVVDWFGVNCTFKFDINLYQSRYKNTIGIYDRSTITYAGLSNEFGSATTHEMVHAITDKTMEGANSITVFSEGLATFLQQIHEKDRPSFYTESYGSVLEAVFSDVEMPLLGDKISFKNFYILKTGNPYRKGNQINLFVLSDCIARDFYLYSEIDSRGGSMLNFKPFDKAYECGIKTYEQASSFISYLYNSYGKEKLLIAYNDVDKIEKIYGKDLWKLIYEWKNYLQL